MNKYVFTFDMDLIIMSLMIDTYVKLDAIGDDAQFIGFVLDDTLDEMTALLYRTDIMTPYPQVLRLKHSTVWGSDVLHHPKKGWKFMIQEIAPARYFDLLIKKTAHQAIVEDL